MGGGEQLNYHVFILLVLHNFEMFCHDRLIDSVMTFPSKTVLKGYIFHHAEIG